MLIQSPIFIVPNKVNMFAILRFLFVYFNITEKSVGKANRFTKELSYFQKSFLTHIYITYLEITWWPQGFLSTI